MKRVMIRWSIGGILIVLGATLYMMLRPDALFGGLPETVKINGEVSDWVKFTLPDALWYSSLLCFMRPLTLRGGRPGPPLTIPAMLSGPAHELLQLAGVAPGTYCPHDMLTYILIFITYLIICLNNKSKRLKKSFLP